MVIYVAWGEAECYITIEAKHQVPILYSTRKAILYGTL